MLKDAEGELRALIHLIKPMKRKLGIILFQLPPGLHLDIPLLDGFLSELPAGYRYAVEFRHRSWLNDLVLSLLELHGVAFCINDFGRMQTEWIATAPFVYIRMHGPLGRYNGKYNAEQLSTLCNKIEGLTADGKDLYCYFNNDMEGFACENAKELEGVCYSGHL